MEIVERKNKIVIDDLDSMTVDSINKTQSKHGSILPNTVRCIISGPSNCGKTSVAFNMLTNPNGLCFGNLYIYSKSLNQPKYQLLEKILSNVPDVNYFKFNSDESIIEPSEANPYSIFLFDDIACENHDKIRSYFSMGRHNNIDCIYIAQTYSKIPKQLIRDNVNLLIIFKQDETNLKHIYKEHVGTDMSFETFKHLCRQAWTDKYGFLVITKDEKLNNGRYQIKFDKMIIIQ